MIDNIYESYKSDELCAISNKDHFTDKAGYLNEFAFNHFTKVLSQENNLPDYFLTCINIDLRLANAESIAVGDYELRKFIISLEDFYVFRIQGEKFNILARKDQLQKLKTILDKPNNKYKVYYGMVKDIPYKPKDEYEERDIILKGIRAMYAHKGEKKVNVSYNIVADKGNVPKELQETKLKKYCSTMWYSITRLIITEPIYKELTVYAFPTAWKEALQSLPLIAAVYDNVTYNVKCDNNIQFGVDGIKFSLTCRFDRDKHLTTSLFALDKCKCDVKTETHEGDYIPAYFGKRLSPTKEIYPIRKNPKGMYDYIIYDEGKIEINTDGYVTTDDGVKYGVFMDDKCLDLIKL